jgi:hypothetical protein
MTEPEGGISPLGLLLLQPINRAPDFSQERCTVYLGLEIVGVQLLDRSGYRPERGNMGPGSVHIEPPQPTICAHQPDRGRGGRIKVILEVEVGAAEVVYR